MAGPFAVHAIVALVSRRAFMAAGLHLIVVLAATILGRTRAGLVAAAGAWIAIEVELFDAFTRPLAGRDQVLVALSYVFAAVTLGDALTRLDEARHAVAGAREQGAETAEQLRLERMRLAAVMHQMPDGVIIADATTGRTIMANARLEELVGSLPPPHVHASDWARQRIRRMDGTEYAPGQTPMGRAIATGTPVLGERMIFRRDDGSERFLEVSAAPIQDGAGTVIAAVLTFRDIGETVAQERRAQDERRIAETLYYIGNRMNAELEPQSVVQTVTDAATRAAGAAFGAFFHNEESPDGERYMLYTLSGAPRSAFEQFPMPRNTDLFGPTFRGERPVRIADVTKDPRYGKNPPYHGMPEGHLPVRSYLAVPVLSRSGEVLGGLFLGHPEPGVFGEREEQLVLGIAVQAAAALDNARLYAAEREAHRQAEEARRRLAILAEAGRVLSSDLDVAHTLGNVARLCVPQLADICIIDLLDEEGRIHRVAATGGGVHESLAEKLQRYPLDPDDATHPMVEVIRNGVPRVMHTIPRSLLEEHALSPERLEAILPLEGCSIVMVPLPGRDRNLGCIAFIRTASAAKPLREEDAPLLEELGRRAAIAVENASLFERQRDVALSLQRSLLPARLPHVPGVETTARYLAGGRGVEVGGDWYDVLPLAGGSIAVVMGDVVGRGIPAASLMAQLRHALRAYALEGLGASAIADRLNKLIQGTGPDALATLLYAQLDLEAGTLCGVSAGHPPAIIVTPDGRARFLEEGRGLPLGALARAQYREFEVTLPPGSLLALYTDGLIERRGVGLGEALERLRVLVERGPEDLDALADHVLAQCIEGTGAEDDAALLLVRPMPLGDRLRLRLPADPAMLAPLRATLRRWLTQLEVEEQRAYEILVATAEACANAIEHASSPGEGMVEVEAEQNGGIAVTVRDQGKWRAPRAGTRGRGIGIMHAFMDDVEIVRRHDGTEVRLFRSLDGDGRVP